jgi:hypothetical protein
MKERSMNLLRLQRVLAVLASAASFVTCASVVRASIAVDPSDYNDSRTTSGNSGVGGGLTWNPANGSWGGGGFTITWDITDNGADFTYRYTIDTTGAKALSHWILELSQFDASGAPLTSDWEDIFEDMTAGDYDSSGINDGANEVPTNPFSPSNPGIPGDIYGVKFNTSGDPNVSWVEFTTPQAPVWGDFYGKDGTENMGADEVYIYNTGYGMDPLGTDFTDWIARPNGASQPPGTGSGGAIPEAASLIVWSLLVGAMGLVSQRRRQGIVA